MSKYTDKRKATNQKWDKQNIKRVSIALPLEAIPQLQAQASAQGQTMHKYLLSCIEAQTGIDLTADSRTKHDSDSNGEQQ